MENALQRRLKVRHDNGVADVIISICWPEQRDNSWFAEWVITLAGSRAKGGGWRRGRDSGVAPRDQHASVQNSIAARSMRAQRLSWADDWSGYGFPVPPISCVTC